MSIFSTITMICQEDIPTELISWLEEESFYLGGNDIVQTGDDGNPFSEWLKAEGYEFHGRYSDGREKPWDEIAIFGS